MRRQLGLDAEAGDRAQGHLRILLVEDDPDGAMAIARLLSLRGHEVEIASTLHHGLELARERLDLIITDIDLPDGNGLDLLQMLPEPAPAAMVLSGFGGREFTRRSRAAGFREHLVKPVDAETLLAAIARSLPDADHRVAG